MPGLTGCHHPVGREPDFFKLPNICRSQIRDRFANRHSTTRLGIDHRQWGTLADTNGLTGIGVIASCCNTDIRYRDLPGPNHLIPCYQSGYSPVTNGDQKSLVCNCWVTEYLIQQDFEWLLPAHRTYGYRVTALRVPH